MEVDLKDIKDHIDNKFAEHEKLDKARLDPIIKTLADHENILRGRDRTSGMIKKMNYLWVLATGGAASLAWKAWDFLSNTPSH